MRHVIGIALQLLQLTAAGAMVISLIEDKPQLAIAMAVLPWLLFILKETFRLEGDEALENLAGMATVGLPLVAAATYLFYQEMEAAASIPLAVFVGTSLMVHLLRWIEKKRGRQVARRVMTAWSAIIIAGVVVPLAFVAGG